MNIYWTLASIPILRQFSHRERRRIWKEAIGPFVYKRWKFWNGLAYAISCLAVISCAIFWLGRQEPWLPPMAVAIGAFVFSGIVLICNQILIRLMLPSLHLYLRGYCHECGYDLTGNHSGICPECGTVTLGIAKPMADIVSAEEA